MCWHFVTIVSQLFNKSFQDLRCDFSSNITGCLFHSAVNVSKSENSFSEKKNHPSHLHSILSILKHLTKTPLKFCPVGIDTRFCIFTQLLVLNHFLLGSNSQTHKLFFLVKYKHAATFVLSYMKQVCSVTKVYCSDLNSSVTQDNMDRLLFSSLEACFFHDKKTLWQNRRLEHSPLFCSDIDSI